MYTTAGHCFIHTAAVVMAAADDHFCSMPMHLCQQMAFWMFDIYSVDETEVFNYLS